MLHQIQFLFSDVIFFLKREMIIFYFFSIVGRRKAILPSCAIISRLKEWVGGGNQVQWRQNTTFSEFFQMRTRGQQEWFDCIQNQINIAVSIQTKCSFPNWHCSFYRFFFRVAFAVTSFFNCFGSPIHTGLPDSSALLYSNEEEEIGRPKNGDQ